MHKIGSFKVLISISAVVITYIFLEVFVRVTEDEPCAVTSRNQKLVYELNPRARGINRHGMRDPEFDEKELQNKYIIAVIGDSHTYGAVENVSETFPSRVQFYLRQLTKQDYVRVLNFGVDGYNAAQELEVLKSKALNHKPDLVILQYCINDTYVCNYIWPRYRSLNSLIYKSRFLTYAWKRILYSAFGQDHLYNLISHAFPDMLLYQEGLVGTLTEDEHPVDCETHVPEKYHYMLGMDNFKKHMREFALICGQKNIRMIATGFIEKEDGPFYENIGFDVYTFYDIFSGLTMRDYGYDPQHTSTHFNATGNDFIGKSLANHIYERYLKENPLPHHTADGGQ